MKKAGKNNYKQFSTNDFLCDEFFQEWVLKKTLQANEFWERWLVANPEKQNEVNDASALLRHIGFREHQAEEGLARASLNHTLEVIRGAEILAMKTSRSITWRSKLLKVAAVFIFIITSVVLFNQFKKQPLTEIATAYGTVQSVILPDSSRVILNANSKISFQKKWTNDAPREMWLEGEAHFAVTHLNTDKQVTPGERFLVHVKDVTVEVLGTTFNVRQRSNNTSILLKSGRVELSINDARSTKLVLNPGQLIAIDNLTKQYQVNTVENPEELSAWTNKKIILKNTSLKAIIYSLEEYYGVKIVVADSALFKRNIEGVLILDNLDDALFVLSNILNVKTKKEKNTIFLMPK
jgi:transmembrane sensor